MALLSLAMLGSSCANDHPAELTDRELTAGLQVIERCMADQGYSSENVEDQIRNNVRFRAAVDECGGDTGVGAADVLDHFAAITRLNNRLVRRDQECMRRAGFDIATYTDRANGLHLADFDSTYVNAGNVDEFFDAYATCVDLPRSNFPTSQGFPTSTVAGP